MNFRKRVKLMPKKLEYFTRFRVFLYQKEVRRQEPLAIKEATKMTAIVKSQTSDTRYFLTINETTGHASDCSCKNRYYRRHTCEHMSSFDAEVQRAAIFQALRQHFDCRLNGDEQTRRCNFEMSLGY